MDLSVIDPNTKLVAVYYNGEKQPYLFRVRTDVTLSGWRIRWIKLIVNSTIETQGGCMVLSIDSHRPTLPELCGSSWWSSWTTTTWEPCSRYLVSTVLKTRSSWTLRWSDMLEKFRKVWSGPGIVKRSWLCWRNQTKNLV